MLFVTNGNGEAAIAATIARELRRIAPLRTEHLALVGSAFGDDAFVDVGPQRTMPSGGLVAMGNVRAFARDLGAGFAGLFAAQIAFLRAARGRYAAVIAVGDAYACALARVAAAPIAFVGTAKSEYVAPYGAIERRIIGSAQLVFVRDRATARALRTRGVDAVAPGNVIVDLVQTQERYPWRAPLRIALLPGSRERAYGDAARLARVARATMRRLAGTDAALSIAPALDPQRFEAVIAGDEPAVGSWRGPVGALIAGATLVLGQAGTANEAAAAAGVPVVALEFDDDRRDAWYRMRQSKLLGDALLVLPGQTDHAAGALVELLCDPERRARMGAVGRDRMGAPGGALTIAGAIAALAERAR